MITFCAKQELKHGERELHIYIIMIPAGDGEYIVSNNT